MLSVHVVTNEMLCFEPTYALTLGDTITFKMSLSVVHPPQVYHTVILSQVGHLSWYYGGASTSPLFHRTYKIQFHSESF